MKSILQTNEQCFLCGSKGQLETHHIFFGNPGRQISEQYGFKIRLCPNCHRISSNSPHQNRTLFGAKNANLVAEYLNMIDSAILDYDNGMAQIFQILRIDEERRQNGKLEQPKRRKTEEQP